MPVFLFARISALYLKNETNTAAKFEALRTAIRRSDICHTKISFSFFFFEKNHPVRHKHIAIFVAIHRVNLSVNLEPMRL